MNDPWFNKSNLARVSLSELRLVQRNYNDIDNHFSGYSGWFNDKLSDELKTLLQDQQFSGYYYNLRYDQTPRNFENTLTIEEEAVLKFYTTHEGYEALNIALRTGIMNDFLSIQARLMNQALNKLPNSIHNNDELFRLERHSDEDLKRIFVEGTNFEAKGFWSATYLPEAIGKGIGIHSDSVLIRIKGKNAKHIEDLATDPREREVLFTSYSNFRVKQVGESINPKDNNTIRTVWVEEL